MNILVLGAGRMGLGAVYDLAHNSPDVSAITVADHDLGRAQAVAATVGSENVTAVQVDVADFDAAVGLMSGHHATISAVNYWHNANLARAAVAAKVSFCDLGGNNTIVDQELALDAEAQAAGINIIPDCGLAPGMVSVLAAHGAARFTVVKSIKIRVGGLPQDPKPPLNYQIVFAVEGLINEYIERARVIRGGVVTEVDSMTELESLEFPAPYGQMEAFQTSGGTSTLVDTFLGRVDELDYKTIRYPGHCDKFKTMLDLGLAESTPVVIEGVSVAPRKVFGDCLVRHLPADEPDLVFVRLEFRGTMDGRETGLRYDIIDKFDERTKLSAMMRTTSFPASIIAQMMARGDTLRRGATPQEVAIPPEQFVAELDRRNIKIEESRT
ncbi:MAG: saccharopine dehydrogenase C-terminal domain-containing protein [Pyrinomonadaceae bacterium]